jgi:hypothetical protein
MVRDDPVTRRETLSPCCPSTEGAAVRPTWARITPSGGLRARVLPGPDQRRAHPQSSAHGRRDRPTWHARAVVDASSPYRACVWIARPKTLRAPGAAGQGLPMPTFADRVAERTFCHAGSRHSSGRRRLLALVNPSNSHSPTSYRQMPFVAQWPSPCSILRR